jgi:hypothetical protein
LIILSPLSHYFVLIQIEQFHHFNVSRRPYVFISYTFSQNYTTNSSNIIINQITPTERVATKATKAWSNKKEKEEIQMPKQNEKTQKVYFGFTSGYSHPKLPVHIFQ